MKYMIPTLLMMKSVCEDLPGVTGCLQKELARPLSSIPHSILPALNWNVSNGFFMFKLEAGQHTGGWNLERAGMVSRD